jgi:hypothetical protein
MFRLTATFLASVAALSDETSLMQGLKPQQVTQKEDKSKAIANLLQSATSMLKNGATPDVVDFAQSTLTEITGVVLPAITDAHNADQALVTSTHALFESEVFAPLRQGQARVDALAAEERRLSAVHITCRGEEEVICGHKRQCDYDLWEIWRRFVEEEETLRQLSLQINNHFCVEGANGTMWIFRNEAVALFPPWITQKPIVERWEHDYDVKVPICEEWFVTLDEKTAECDAAQLALEMAACAHANEVAQVRNTFAEAWAYISFNYQRVINQVHCLEIDRWKEWRTLSTVQCLLDRTTERNGRPCDETTDEVVTEVAACEETQVTTVIDHLRITYPPEPPMPPLPEPPVAPCSAAWIAQEYADLWIPPQPEFHSENSHCNQRPECVNCEITPQTGICVSVIGHIGTWITIPEPEHECAQVTLDQLWEGEFDALGDGHFTFGHTGARSNDILNYQTVGIETPR